MTWFNKISNLFVKRSIEDASVPITSDNIVDFLGSQSSATGITVTPEVALQNPAIWRGVNLISGYVARIPINCYRRTEDDGREKAITHPAHWLLNKSPNKLYTPSVFKRTLIFHAVLYGNGYAYIIRNEFGNPQEALILDPDRTQLIDTSTGYKYETWIGQSKYILPFEDVLHIKGLSPDGLTGFFVSSILKDAIAEGISYIRYSGNYFKNNAKPSVVIELPPNVRDTDKIEEFRRLWGSIHNGLNNSHRPAFVRNGSKVTPLSVSNETIQYFQLRQHDLVMVANFLGIPASKLGASVNTSYGSLEMEEKAFLNDIDVWLVQFEDECNQKLLTERQKYLDTHYFEFDRKALIQIDSTTEKQLIIDYTNNGIMSEEQARQKLNLSFDENGTYRRPSNLLIVGEEEVAPEAPTPELDPTDQTTEEVAPEEELDTLERALAGKLVDRLVKRMARSSGSPITHLEVVLETLEPFQRNEQLKKLLESFEEEWKEILPEQRMNALNTFKDRLWGELWN